MKSSGMNFASGKRSVCFRGFSAAFMLLSICARADGADHNVTAVVGKEAALPCECPPDDPPYVVWQKAVGENTSNIPPLVVKSNKEDEKTAPEYHNRTKLKRENGKCSLVFNKVLLSDQGLYECYYKTRPLKHDKIYLEVTDNQRVSDLSIQKTVVSSSVCGLLVILVTAAAVFVGITCRNRHQTNGAFIATSPRSF
ncbi:myelin-oligodendrocyte glycoprotein-like [Chanodichthys erythropterus]|uniref:myelin-oligodendrocyte glycoprotein-like n=1 Tax=Chanodichthys erythropterus TaxID=933992 RepID=UPI00351E32F8